MTTTLPSSKSPAIVLDASVAVSVTAKEAATEAKASAAINGYLAGGYEFFAPGVIVSELLLQSLHNRALTSQNAGILGGLSV